MRSVKVKFCGITREEDLTKAIELGVDYVGFIMYPKSPRWVGWDRLEALARLSAGVKRVAVFVNPSTEDAKRALSMVDLVQLHGDESFEFARRVGLDRVIKAFRVKGNLWLDERWKGAYAVLLDTYSGQTYGGTGMVFDWSVAKPLVDAGFKVFLSGGLKKDNLADALGTVRSYGVDVSSGIESSPGIKDHKKMEDFFHAVEDALKY